MFSKIEVVNQLHEDSVLSTIRRFGLEYDKTFVFDKIHHEINQLCSQKTLRDVYIDEFDVLDDKLRDALQLDCNKFNTGVSVVAVRATKPRIPPQILENFELMEAQRAEFLVAIERQKVIEVDARTAAPGTL